MRIAFNVEDFVCGDLFKVKTEPKLRSFPNCGAIMSPRIIRRVIDIFSINLILASPVLMVLNQRLQAALPVIRPRSSKFIFMAISTAFNRRDALRWKRNAIRLDKLPGGTGFSALPYGTFSGFMGHLFV